MTSISKDYILEVSKKIFVEEGIASVNMRAIAKECDIALGSIYNYFPSKTDLISEIIESIWLEILDINNIPNKFDSFLDALSFIFEAITNNSKKYPMFFKSHRNFFSKDDKNIGKEKMIIYFIKIKETLLDVLEKDPNIKKEFFTNEITPNLYIEYIFILLLDMLAKDNTNFNPLLAFIKQSIYK